MSKCADGRDECDCDTSADCWENYVCVPAMSNHENDRCVHKDTLPKGALAFLEYLDFLKYIGIPYTNADLGHLGEHIAGWINGRKKRSAGRLTNKNTKGPLMRAFQRFL